MIIPGENTITLESNRTKKKVSSSEYLSADGHKKYFLFFNAFYLRIMYVYWLFDEDQSCRYCKPQLKILACTLLRMHDKWAEGWERAEESGMVDVIYYLFHTGLECELRVTVLYFI